MARRGPAYAAVVALVASLAAVLAAASPARGGGMSVSAGVPRVVVIGVPGLRWEDLAGVPLGDAAVGVTAVRTAADRACAADAWVTVSAGDRARFAGRAGSCGFDLPAPDGGELPGYARVVAANHTRTSTALPGALGDALEAHGGCVAALGAEAAWAAADSRGQVAAYSDLPHDSSALADALTGALARCPVVVAAVPRASARDSIRAALAPTAPDLAVIVVGISDDEATAHPHLHVAIAAGGGFVAGALRSQSTRRAPFVQTIDVAPTVLALRGITQPEDMSGQPWRSTGGRPTIGALRDEDRAAQAQRTALAGWLGLLLGAQAVMYVVGWLVTRRTGPGMRALGHRIVLRTALAGIAALPGAYLANLVPWWRSSLSTVWLLALTAAWAWLIAAASLFGPWRRRPLGPPGIVTGIATLVLAVDVVTGSPLQMDSVLGYSPLVAGRFVGFGNTAYAVFAACSIAATGALVARAGGGRRTTLLIVAVCGAAAVALDGAPAWGSDFGGVLALVPAYALLAMLLLGVRVSWARLVTVGLAAVAVVTAFALLDYARPPARQTHLGRFVGDVLHGGGSAVITRKALANWELLTHNWINPTVPFVTAGLAYLVLRPRPRLRQAYDAAPALRPTLLAIVVVDVIGFLTNDSGVVIPAIGFIVGIPYAVAAVAVTGRRKAATRPTGATPGEVDVLP